MSLSRNERRAQQSEQARFGQGVQLARAWNPAARRCNVAVLTMAGTVVVGLTPLQATRFAFGVLLHATRAALASLLGRPL